MRLGPQVLVFPAYGENPYLNLLSLAARSRGYRFIDAHSFDDLISGLARLRPGDVAHLHWTTPVAQQAGSETKASGRLADLARAIPAAQERGVRVVWTVHNRLPHELPHPQLERRLYALLGARADAIHIMSPATSALLSDVTFIEPARTHLIPHPSYEGVYESGTSTREAARKSFGLTTERAVLFLGQIRPYKGVDQLVEAVTVAATRPGAPETALLLGGVVKEMSREDFAASLPNRPRTIAHLDYVSDVDLERWLLAADVAVLPYRAILNSGSLHLAATFGVPVILPREEHLVRFLDAQPWVRYFDPSRAVASLADLLADPALFADVTTDDFAAFLEPISPWRIATSYADLLDALSASARVS